MAGTRIPGLAGMVLAGGRNTRMAGVDKCRLLVGGRALVERVLGLLEELFAELILVSNGPEREPSLPAGVRVARDIYQGRGPLGGLQAGLAACRAEAALCVACDMPHLSPELIRRQAELFRRRSRQTPPPAIVLPRIGTLIEPLHGIYRRSLEPTIRELLEDGQGYSIRRLFARVPTVYMELPDTPESRRAFFNINTPEDLEAP